MSDLDPETLFNPPRRRRRSGWGWFKGLLIVLFLAAGAVGLALAVSEPFRRSAGDWLGRVKASMSDDAPKDDKRPAPPAGRGGPSGPAKAPPAGPAAPARAMPRPSAAGTTRPAAPTTAPAGGAAAWPATAPASAVAHAATGSADPAEIFASPHEPSLFADPPATRPADGAGRADVAAKTDVHAKPKVITPPAPTGLELQVAQAAVDRLYREGLAAESQQDWAKAIQKYQAAMAYPKEAWRSNLAMKLRIAQEQLKALRPPGADGDGSGQ
jgi:hypothetical protein